MNLKNKVWKYATAFIVFLIILNPETIQLALLVDAVGLEMYLMLFEIQIVIAFGLIFSNKIKLALAYLESFVKNHILAISWKRIKTVAGHLVFAVPAQALLMHILVLSAVVGVVVNVQL